MMYMSFILSIILFFVKKNHKIYNFNMENRIKKQLKHLLLEEDVKIKDLIPLLSKKAKKEYSYDSFIHRLGRATITYEEMIDIADVLGYDIQFVKRS